MWVVYINRPLRLSSTRMSRLKVQTDTHECMRICVHTRTVYRPHNRCVQLRSCPCLRVRVVRAALLVLTVCSAGPISVYIRTVTTVLKSCEATTGTALQPEPTSARFKTTAVILYARSISCVMTFIINY